MNRRPFAPLALPIARRAAERSHALARFATLLPTAVTTMAMVVAACISTARRTPPELPSIQSDFESSTGLHYKWPSQRVRHLRVWVEPWSTITGWTPDHVSDVDRALLDWSREGSVGFTRVSRSQDADIRLRWTQRLPDSHPGATTLIPDAKGALAQADVWINVGSANGAVLFGIIAHELGHALGLSHSPSTSALMYPVLHRTSVSDRDLEALRGL